MVLLFDMLELLNINIRNENVKVISLIIQKLNHILPKLQNKNNIIRNLELYIGMAMGRGGVKYLYPPPPRPRGY